MKKIVLILVPVLLVGGGGTFFAASKGMINIPGITPKKVVKKTTPAKDAPEKPSKKTPPKKKDPTPGLDVEQGQTQLASIWADLEADQLASITETWLPRDLAPILLKMEKGKVTAFLGELEAKRASEISKEIQRLASVVMG